MPSQSADVELRNSDHSWLDFFSDEESRAASRHGSNTQHHSEESDINEEQLRLMFPSLEQQEEDGSSGLATNSILFC